MAATFGQFPANFRFSGALSVTPKQFNLKCWQIGCCLVCSINTFIKTFSRHSSVHYGYPVPGEIIRRSGTISTSKLTSRPLLFQTNIPASWARLLSYSELLVSLKKYSFLPTFPETNESNAEEVEITKELLWDEAEHSECTERKKKHSKCHLCNANYKTNTKLQKHMNPMPSEFKLCYLCAEKFSTDEKFINHRLCMHNAVVNQMSFV